MSFFEAAEIWIVTITRIPEKKKILLKLLSKFIRNFKHLIQYMFPEEYGLFRRPYSQEDVFSRFYGILL